MPDRIALLTFCAVPSLNLEIGLFLVARSARPRDHGNRPKQVRLKKCGNRLIPAKNYVEAATASVTPMRSPHGGDAGRMTGGGEPVMNGRPDPAPFQRRLALAFMPGDQEQNPVARGDRAFQCAVDRVPCPIKIMPVQVEGSIGLDPPRPQAAIPAAVEGRLLQRGGSAKNRRYRARGRDPAPRLPGPQRHGLGWLLNRLARQRSDGRRNLRPKGGFVRGELAHAPPCPWAAGRAPGPWPTCLQRSLRQPLPRPRMYRIGLRP